MKLNAIKIILQSYMYKLIHWDKLLITNGFSRPSLVSSEVNFHTEPAKWTLVDAGRSTKRKQQSNPFLVSQDWGQWTERDKGRLSMSLSSGGPAVCSCSAPPNVSFYQRFNSFVPVGDAGCHLTAMRQHYRNPTVPVQGWGCLWIRDW